MQQSDKKPNMIASLNFKGHKFTIATLRDEFLKFESVTEIKVDDIPIMELTDVYADFQDNKIDLLHYHNHLSAGLIDLETLIQWKEAKNGNNKG